MGRDIDWHSIKTEYVTTNISYRKLCDKYGIEFGSLRRRAKKEEWVQLREQFRHNAYTKTIEKVEAQAANYSATLYDLAFKMAEKLTRYVDNTDIEDMIAQDVKPKDITGALRDLKDVLNVKSERDIREQEARIDKLRHDCAVDDSDDKEYGVALMPAVEPVEEPHDE